MYTIVKKMTRKPQKQKEQQKPQKQIQKAWTDKEKLHVNGNKKNVPTRINLANERTKHETVTHGPECIIWITWN